MKKLHVVLLLIFYYTLPAQDKVKIDSLNQVLTQKNPDSVHVKTWLALAEEYYLSSPEKAIDYCSKAQALSEKINFNNGISASYGWLAYLNEQQGNINVALNYYKKSQALFEKSGNKKEAATCLNNIAAIYKDQGRIDDALKYHNRSLAIKQEIGDKDGIATSYNNIGLIYSSQGKIPLALDYYTKALKIEEEIKNDEGIATALLNIGTVYKNQQQYEEALSYYRRSLAIDKKINDKYSIGYSLNVIGSLLEELGQLDSALYYYKQALLIRTELEDKQGIAYSNKNMGVINEKKGSLEESENLYRTSLSAFTEVGDKWGMAIANNKLGGILLSKGNYPEAEKSLKQSLLLAQELGFPSDISKAADNLQKLYRNKKDWQQALVMNDLYVRMRDSVANDNNRKISMKNQFQYEYDKREAILKSEQEKKDAVNNAALYKQKILLRSFIAGAILLLVIVFILINRYRFKQKANKELSIAYDNLQAAQQQLIESEKMAAIGEVASRVAHEIQNPLNFVNNLSRLTGQLITEMEETTDADEKEETLTMLKENAQKINEHGVRASSIVKELLDRTSAGTAHEFFQEK